MCIYKKNLSLDFITYIIKVKILLSIILILPKLEKLLPEVPWQEQLHEQEQQYVQEQLGERPQEPQLPQQELLLQGQLQPQQGPLLKGFDYYSSHQYQSECFNLTYKAP